MFSTYALQGIETKTKGVYTREELAPLAQTNVESLKEFGFFTFAKADGKKEKFLEPVDYYLEQKDGALVLHFTLPFKTPFKTKALALEVFDPSYFVDFSLQKADPIRLVGAPAAARCDPAADRRHGRRPEAQRADLHERRQLELRRDVRQQDHGGLSVTAPRVIASERSNPIERAEGLDCFVAKGPWPCTTGKAVLASSGAASRCWRSRNRRRHRASPRSRKTRSARRAPRRTRKSAASSAGC